jgi:hypothetical protein
MEKAKFSSVSNEILQEIKQILKDVKWITKKQSKK